MLRTPSLSLAPRFCPAVEDDLEVMECLRDQMSHKEKPVPVCQMPMAMRAKLVNWLIEVCLHFHLHPMTLHLCIAYLDAYGRLEAIKKQQLQLLGVACLLIAAKLEEIYPPNLRDLAALCDGSCSGQEIAMMELKVLSRLEWNLSPPTALFWLNCYVALMPLQPTLQASLREECMEVLMLSLHHDNPYLPSQLAAACLAMRLNNLALIHQVTGYDWEHLNGCMEWLWDWTKLSLPYEAIRRGEKSPIDFNQLLTGILQRLDLYN